MFTVSLSLSFSLFSSTDEISAFLMLHYYDSVSLSFSLSPHITWCTWTHFHFFMVTQPINRLAFPLEDFVLFLLHLEHVSYFSSPSLRLQRSWILSFFSLLIRLPMNHLIHDLWPSLPVFPPPHLLLLWFVYGTEAMAGSSLDTSGPSSRRTLREFWLMFRLWGYAVPMKIMMS